MYLELWGFLLWLVVAVSISGPGWARGTALSIYFSCFFSPSAMGGLLTSVHQWVLVCIWRQTLSSSRGFILWEAVFSLVLFPLILVILVSLDFQYCFLCPESLPVSFSVIPSCTEVWASFQVSKLGQ